MSRLARAVGEVSRAMGELKVAWALVGGLAVSVRAEPRMTRDVDVAVAAASDAEAEKIVRELGRRGFAPGEFLLEQEAAGRLATVRLIPPGESSAGVVVDLLFASSGIEAEIVADAESIEVLPGLVVPVARSGHLVALKLLAARPLDLADAKALVAIADEIEIERARDAVATITLRGFHRGIDLARSLGRLVGGDDLS